MHQAPVVQRWDLVKLGVTGLVPEGMSGNSSGTGLPPEEH